MRRVLILGYVDDAVSRLGDACAGPTDCRLIGLSPAISECLRERRLPHVSVLEYVGSTEWEAIHEEIGRVLQGLSANVRDVNWLDDWSHLIVDEARALVFWSQVARRILDVEHPAEVFIQKPLESHSSHHALISIASAYRLLGQQVESWQDHRWVG